jgi:hypothetical protein
MDRSHQAAENIPECCEQIQEALSRRSHRAGFGSLTECLSLSCWLRLGRDHTFYLGVMKRSRNLEATFKTCQHHRGGDCGIQRASDEERRRTSGRLTPLKVSQHDLIERHIVGPQQEPRRSKFNPDDMVLWCKSKAQVLGSGAGSALSLDKVSLELYGMMDYTAKERGAARNGHVARGTRPVRGRERRIIVLTFPESPSNALLFWFTMNATQYQ